VIKSRTIWARHVACTEEEKCNKILVRNMMGTDHMGNLYTDGRIIRKWILETKYDDVDMFHLVLNKDLTNMLMDLQVS
jgi:hypothetical protein